MFGGSTKRVWRQGGDEEQKCGHAQSQEAAQEEEEEEVEEEAEEGSVKGRIWQRKGREKAIVNRVIWGGKRRTPVPSWKLYENPFYEGLAAAVAAAAKARHGKERAKIEQEEAMAAREAQAMAAGNEAQAMAAGKEAPAMVARKEAPAMAKRSYGDKGVCSAAIAFGDGRAFVSARKLAASLWEEIPISSRAAPPSIASPCSHLQSRPPSSLSASDSPRPSKLPEMPRIGPQPTTMMPPLKTIAVLRSNTSAESISQANSASQSSASNESSVDTDAVAAALGNNFLNDEADLIVSPRDFVKGCNNLRSLEEQQQTSNASIVSALLKELELARARLQELELSQKSARKEVDVLLRKCGDERAMLRKREQERIQAAMLSIREELEDERRARKKLESQNRKLSRHLSEANKAVVEALEELDKEREARKLMEDVCDELAREIGQDKAEVEEMKRDHAKAKDEMEEERRMLQVAEAWREERVQMKLSDARLELEEKSMALDELRMELEQFLRSTDYPMEGDVGQLQQLHANQAKILREAVGKLQAQTSVSICLMEDRVCQQPPGSDDADSSDSSQWVVHPNVNENGRLWTNRRRSSRRRRNRGLIRSYGSRSGGLNKLGIGQAGSEEGGCILAAEREEEASESEHANRYDQAGEESNWGGDQDDENGRDEWQSGTEMEEKNEFRSSPELSEKKIHRFSGNGVRMDRNGHDRRMYEKNLSVSIVGTNASARGGNNSVSKVEYHVVEDSNSTAAECSPNLQQPLSNPSSSGRKGGWSLAGRTSVDSSMDCLRPYRSNSLQAKLLEDTMSSPEFQSRHSRGRKARR